MVRKSELVRASKDLAMIINFIKAQHLLKGKKPPTTRAITAAIAKRIKKEDLLRDDFIKF